MKPIDLVRLNEATKSTVAPDRLLAHGRFEALPEILRERPQWIVWRVEMRPNGRGNLKATKVPYDPNSRRHASSTDPTTWAPFDVAVQAFDDGGFSGIGFVFTADDPYTGIDLDNCRDPETGNVEQWAWDIIMRLGSYTEVSPSGTGLHMIGKATLPIGGRRKGNIEMYDEGRFFCMTGEHAKGTPETIEIRQAEVEALHAKTFGTRRKETTPPAPTAPFECGGVDLDDDALLEKARAAKNGGRFARLHDAGDTSGYPSPSEADLALCSYLAFWTNSDPMRMDRLFRRSALIRSKWDERHFGDGRTYGAATIEHALMGVSNGYGAGHPSRGDGTKAAEGRDSDAPRERPAITVEGGALPLMVDQAEKALLADPGPRIYQRVGLLVRVIRTESPVVRRGLKREAGALVIHPIEAPYLVERFTGAANWLKYDARSRDMKAVDCPDKVVKSYMARRGSWQVAPLIGIIEAPTLRWDGSILDKPGYDEATGLFFDPGQYEFPKIPDRPSQSEAFNALEELRDILKDFPFVDPLIDRMAAVAAILTALVRKSLPSAPLFVFRAPKMRSGKTLLADVVSMLATGRKCAVMSQALGQERSNEERKRLLAILIEGDPVVNFDNCEHALEGAALCTAITQETIKDRVLGISKTATASTSVTFLATGNNLVIAGDLSARVVPCDLDPQVERPEERVFDRDLYEFVPANRGRFVAAALTILRAYHMAGMPEQAIHRWGGFDEWSRWIRGSLVWIAQTDPTAGRARLEVVDPIRQSLRPILLAWCEAFQARAVTVAEAVRESDTHPDLKAAFFDQAGDSKGGIRTKSLGRFLEKHADRIEGGLRIERAGDRQGKALWRVRRIAET